MSNVVFATSKGNITIEVFDQEAPITAKNFLDYVDQGFFSDIIFHRVIPGFVIQGGGFTADMVQKKNNPSIKNEADNGLKNDRGTLSMARTSDPDSATSQFFINLCANASLDRSPGSDGYAVFGKVTQGMDVVDAIAAVETGSHGMHDDVPTTPVVIQSAARAKG